MTIPFVLALKQTWVEFFEGRKHATYRVCQFHGDGSCFPASKVFGPLATRKQYFEDVMEDKGLSIWLRV
jgi:hypothetical protein